MHEMKRSGRKLRTRPERQRIRNRFIHRNEQSMRQRKSDFRQPLPPKRGGAMLQNLEWCAKLFLSTAFHVATSFFELAGSRHMRKAGLVFVAILLAGLAVVGAHNVMRSIAQAGGRGAPFAASACVHSHGN